MMAASRMTARRTGLVITVAAMSLAMVTTVAQPATSALKDPSANSPQTTKSSMDPASDDPYPDGPAAAGDFVLLHSRIADAYPDDFTRSLTDEKGAHTIWFKGAVPPEAAEWSAALGDIMLVPNAGYSGRELEDYTSRLLTARPTNAADPLSIVITPVEADQVIHVTFGPGYGGSGLPDASAVKASMEAFVLSNPPPAGFRVAFGSVDHQIAQPEAPDAGRTFYYFYAGST